MGNTDSVPVVSQMKSLVEYAGGNSTAARITQENFAYRNTFPVISQISSIGYAIGGHPDQAMDLQHKFEKDMLKTINTIPVAGHIKGAIHFAKGEIQEAEEAMKAASRTTSVLTGSVGGFAVGGPVGAVAGGIGGGAVADVLLTGGDILAKGNKAKPYGYVKTVKDVKDAVEGKKIITPGEGFEIALVPILDGLSGFGVGKFGGKPLGLNVMESSKLAPSGGKGLVYKIVDDAALARKNTPVGSGFEKAALENRANQLNPNHVQSGPGRPAGYKGIGTKADLDNHANQLNPNNRAYYTSGG